MYFWGLVKRGDSWALSLYVVSEYNFVLLYVVAGDDQVDCKPDPSLLLRNAVSSSPPR